MIYKTLIENLDYFDDLSDLVPLGSLLGNSELDCSKEEFKIILIEVLEKYSEAFEILSAT
jgi:hypothetical protein